MPSSFLACWGWLFLSIFLVCRVLRLWLAIGAFHDDLTDHYHCFACGFGAVPPSMLSAALSLGATRMQGVWHHVLPSAMPGVLTGAIIGMARALGETAPLLVIGIGRFYRRSARRICRFGPRHCRRRFFCGQTVRSGGLRNARRRR